MAGLFVLSLPPVSGVPSWRQWPLFTAFAVRALFELAVARCVFARVTVPEILARNAQARAGTQFDARLVDWISYTVPRVARRVPFRSDCMVQALAAQRWLVRFGIASEIVIGAERPAGQFASHAWLTCRGINVTGGTTGQYTVIV